MADTETIQKNNEKIEIAREKNINPTYTVQYTPPTPRHSPKRANGGQRHTQKYKRCEFLQKIKGKYKETARYINTNTTHKYTEIATKHENTKARTQQILDTK